MTVVKINEECHGFIGIAKDDKSAQNYVIDSWLTGDVYVQYLLYLCTRITKMSKKMRKFLIGALTLFVANSAFAGR